MIMLPGLWSSKVRRKQDSVPSAEIVTKRRLPHMVWYAPLSTLLFPDVMTFDINSLAIEVKVHSDKFTPQCPVVSLWAALALGSAEPHANRILSQSPQPRILQWLLVFQTFRTNFLKSFFNMSSPRPAKKSSETLCALANAGTGLDFLSQSHSAFRHRSSLSLIANATVCNMKKASRQARFAVFSLLRCPQR
jgi:hypothetical protein